jgi:hypothetical protein
MATMQSSSSANTGRWITQGVIGGIIAGIVFAMFEMVMAALLMGSAAFFMPLRMIGAIVLGQPALDPGYPLLNAAIVGMIVHMVLSIIFGAIFAAITATVPALRQSGMVLLVVASVFGLALWIINFYVLASLFGWNWFPTQTNPIVQFIAHTFFYGTVLGLYLSRVLLPRAELTRMR